MTKTTSNKDNPARVFIGIPTWNRPEFVKDTIQSVIAQKFSHFRCIVNDNCSAPGVADKVKDFVSSINDARFSFHEQPVNCGENGQCQWFLNQCNEEYFVFLHDDDRIEPELIDVAIKTLDKHPDISFFTANQYLFDENGKILPKETAEYNHTLMRYLLSDGPVDNILELVLQRGMFGLSGTVFRTSTLKECGLEDSSNTYPFDFNVMLRQAVLNKLAWWDNRKLSGYRWHSEQTSKENCWEYDEHHILGYMEMLKHRKFTGKAENIRKEMLAFSYRRYAYILYCYGKWSEGHRYLRQGISLTPFKRGMWVYFVFASTLPFLIKPFWGNKITYLNKQP